MLALFKRAKVGELGAGIQAFLVAIVVSSFSYNATALTVAPQVRLPAEFTFKDVVHIKHTRIMLADIATCAGTQRICDEASGVDLGPVPEAGQVTYLPKAKLLKLLTQEWPWAAVTVTGAHSVKIVPIVETITEDQVKVALMQWIKDHQPVETDIRIIVESVQLPKPVVVTPGDYRLVFPFYSSEHEDSWSRLDWIGSKFIGTKNIEIVRESGGGKKVDRFHATVQCAASVQVPVTSQRILQGTILRDRHIEMGWQPLQRTHHEFIRNKKELYGRVLTRSLQIGEGITRSQVKIPQIVKRGELLQLTVSRNGLEVVSEVKALGHGGYGDTIYAKPAGTNKKLRVRIVAPGKAEALF